MARRPPPAAPKKPKGPKVNQDITAERILLIDENGEKQGVMPIAAALEAAREAGLDLVEVAPEANNPVCKILDYGKMRFQAQKKRAESKKKQKTADLKEIKMRPNIDVHDYQVKIKAMTRFFAQGDKVKVTIRFRGREMAHQDRGANLLQRVRDDFEDSTKVEFEPKTEGRQMMMVLAPK
ncbi:MAG: translation initiation factor IF-3 [Robiginitomaculum sp.]|nr:translation initiation factor IF-3 [Robiginitomaculum sp.]